MLRPLLAAAFLLFAPPAGRKLYVDRPDAVSFSYPASWLLNADDDAATAKLRLADLAPAHAVVQLQGSFANEGPYKNTDFEAGAFAYTLPSAENEAACFELLDRMAPGKPALLAAYPAKETRFSGMVAGTEDLHHAFAVFREGHCYLFETVLIRRAPDAVEKPLSSGQWQRLAESFDAIVRSVRLMPVHPH